MITNAVGKFVSAFFVKSTADYFCLGYDPVKDSYFLISLADKGGNALITVKADSVWEILPFSSKDARKILKAIFNFDERYLEIIARKVQ